MPLQGLRSALSFLAVFSAIPLKAARDAASSCALPKTIDEVVSTQYSGLGPRLLITFRRDAGYIPFDMAKGIFSLISLPAFCSPDNLSVPRGAHALGLELHATVQHR